MPASKGKRAREAEAREDEDGQLAADACDAVGFAG
jgi:hypothetical protein